MATKCTAKSKQTGKRCGGWAVPGGDKCHWHGGKTPRGIALPQTKHGRYSKSLPTRMLAVYEAALVDPELLSTRDDMAKLVARLVDLHARVDTGEAGGLWRGVRVAWREYKRAQAGGKTDVMGAAAATLDRLIDDGVADYLAWDEILKTAELIRRLRETERKRLEALHATVTADQLAVFVGALTDSVRRHITDRKVLDAIGRDIEQLVAQPHGA